MNQTFYAANGTGVAGPSGQSSGIAPSSVIHALRKEYNAQEFCTVVVDAVLAPFLDDLPEPYRTQAARLLADAQRQGWVRFIAYRQRTVDIKSRIERIYEMRESGIGEAEDVKEMKECRRVMVSWLHDLWKAGVYRGKMRVLVDESLAFLYSAHLDLRHAARRRAPDLMHTQVIFKKGDVVMHTNANIRDAIVWVWRELLVAAQADDEMEFVDGAIKRLGNSEVTARMLKSLPLDLGARKGSKMRVASELVYQQLERVMARPNFDLMRNFGFYRPDEAFFD